MKIATVILRTLLGLAFVFFGLNGFLHFMKASPPSGQAGAFIMAMFTSGYFYAVAALQIIGGLLLLIGRFVPLGLTLLSPIVVNIVLFHVCLDPQGLPIAVVFACLTAFLLWSYRASFAPLLKA
jgi:uncharacterized membrane protein YphA (DoxX/SURF4 family)